MKKLFSNFNCRSAHNITTRITHGVRYTLILFYSAVKFQVMTSFRSNMSGTLSRNQMNTLYAVMYGFQEFSFECYCMKVMFCFWKTLNEKYRNVITSKLERSFIQWIFSVCPAGRPATQEILIQTSYVG